MKLFLIGWGDDRPELIDLVVDLKKNHEIAYWTGDSLTPDVRAKFSGTIFHEYYKAYDGIPAENIDMNAFDPPGDEFLRQVSDVEAIVLPMMDKRFDWMPTSQRKHFFYSLVRYWKGVLEKFKPDVIVFAGPPHAVYDYVLYSLAQRFSIRTIIFFETLMHDRFLAMNNFKEGSLRLARELQNPENFSLSDLSPDLREYFERQTNPTVDNRPQYFKKGLAQYSGIKLARVKALAIVNSIKNRTLFTNILHFLEKKFKHNTKEEHTVVQSSAIDLEKKFVYLPLHYQPECSTSTLGGVFSDQILMIETVSAALPEGWVIYVKEHPGQWLPRGYNFSGSRYEGYYKMIARIPHVCIVPPETDTFTLINKSQTVATITGTAAWEAVFRAKPALIFGFPWFQQCPGMMSVHDTASCKQALSKVQSGFSVRHQDMINYLHAFDAVASRGYFSFYTKGLSELSEAENKKNIFAALVSELEHTSQL